eukprot:s1080_g12.t1
MKEMAKGMDEPRIDILNHRRRSSSSSRTLESAERLALEDLPQEAQEAAGSLTQPSPAAAEALTAATIPCANMSIEADKNNAENTGAAPCEEKQEPDSLADFEQKAFEQLQARNKEKKGKKQESKEKEPKGLKRPAAAKKACVPQKAAKKTLETAGAAQAAPKAAALPAQPKANCWGCSKCSLMSASLAL